MILGGGGYKSLAAAGAWFTGRRSLAVLGFSQSRFIMDLSRPV
jgi:hypothetical protein